MLALVTGASSGIGTCFARALAARGYDLALVARRRDRLEELAAELPTTTHVFDCDLGRDAALLPARVREAGLEVDLLVNNAGFGSWGRFLELDPEREVDQIRLNCEAVVTLTHAFAKPMVDRGRGGVITIASTAGHQPLPYEAVYAATKAFARSFTLALGEELRGSGVKVLCVDPGPVRTDWQETAGYDDTEDTKGVPSLVEPEQVVDEALAAFDAGKRSLVPGRTMRWIMRLTAPAPRGVKLRVVERNYRPKRK